MDAGLAGQKLIEAIDAGTLPHVVFYKPQGTLNEHPGYAEVQAGDRHIAADHTPHDTASILRLITARFNLPILAGLSVRDKAIAAGHGGPLGDLTAALNLPRR